MSKSTFLVVWGINLTSSVGNGRITKQESNMVKLPYYQKNVIIGLLLSDGWLTFGSKRSNYARLRFKQSLSHSTYVWFVFNILSHYCNSGPYLTTSTRAGKTSYALGIFTRSLSCFTELYSIFYPNGIKVIPENIYNLLTPVALAHLIMGDGGASRHGLVLYTNSFSIQDIVKLINVLIIKYDLKCSIHLKRRNQKIEYLVYISQDSLPILRKIVLPLLYLLCFIN
uniref:Homing endonuclease LAGLIDADG domain-containing protein n=1 Tax=Arthrobotrys musiformis TaxID=47236 RepID=A0A482EAG9_9PEZI|nr:hypothetical protein [Arthrobotrys musiformis]